MDSASSPELKQARPSWIPAPRQSTMAGKAAGRALVSLPGGTEVGVPRNYCFGRFELRSTERQLLSEGNAVPLGARAFDLLLALVEGHDRLVTKRELLDRVWPGVIVEEAN